MASDAVLLPAQRATEKGRLRGSVGAERRTEQTGPGSVIKPLKHFPSQRGRGDPHARASDTGARNHELAR
eukprot:2212570-Pyramimonas_sp.AAC.1